MKLSIDEMGFYLSLHNWRQYSTRTILWRLVDEEYPHRFITRPLHIEEAYKWQKMMEKHNDN
jgi:hypothetical protein